MDWKPWISRFGNDKDYHLWSGYMEYRMDPRVCLENCSILEGEVRRECENHCRQRYHDFWRFNRFASQKCPTGDPVCCRNEAGINDFAYRLCRRPPVWKETMTMTTQHVFLILLFLLILIMIGLHRQA